MSGFQGLECGAGILLAQPRTVSNPWKKWAAAEAAALRTVFQCLENSAVDVLRLGKYNFQHEPLRGARATVIDELRPLFEKDFLHIM
jgi:hypothetical protein